MRVKKKRQRRVSVLLIPDDNAEPHSFRLSWPFAKLLIVIGAVLVLHIIGGGIAYWKFFQVRGENGELERSNTRLLEDNKRVYQLAAQLEEMSKEQSKILSLLGVDANAHGGNLNLVVPEPPPFMASKVNTQPPSVSNESMHEFSGPTGGFMIRRRAEHSKYPRNLPTMLPVEGFLTTEFSRSQWYPFRSHPGIDIAAKRGSVVMAAGDGQVVFANWTYDLGNLIIIHHGDNIFSYYGHNERILVSEKAFVKKGETIALLGNSGKSSGPHLHFEIWKDGVAIDPRQVLLAFHANSK
jgi:murein DD-endopeptidase MepM/ murein hydrolase activator NlpD